MVNIPKILLLLLTLLMILQILPTSVFGLKYMKNEMRVIEKILDYPNNKKVVPIERVGEPVNIKFYPSLIRIIRISERDQYIEVYMWLRMEWFHPSMQWNTTEYGGVESVQVSSEDIWVPDIVLYNSVNSEDPSSADLSSYKATLRVENTGEITWLKPVILRSTCIIDVSHFPFDDQKCKLKFGSWTNHHDFIDLTAKKRGRIPDYIPNGQWHLLSLETQRNVVTYACCHHKYVDVTVTVKVRRDTASYTINLVMPSALLSSLVLLTFILPPESGERVSLCITVLLSVTVFQQLTAEMMPEFALPYLAQYYFATMIVTAVSLLVTTLILNMYHRDTRRTPKFVRKFVLGFLGSLLFCKCTAQEVQTDHEPVADGDFQVNKQRRRTLLASAGLPRNKTQVAGIDAEPILWTTGNHCASYVHCQPPTQPPTDEPMNDSVETRRKEWLKVARVLDRLFLIAFSIIMAVTFLAIFLRAPRFLG